MKCSQVTQSLLLWLLMVGIGFVSAAEAGVATFAPQSVQPKPLQLQMVPTKPAVCAAGFTPVNVKLVSHQGHKWYQYDCVQQKVIARTCNLDTDVIDVENKFISLPSDGQSNKSKLMMSYSCYNYVPVE